jgi:hypothetical protein
MRALLYEAAQVMLTRVQKLSRAEGMGEEHCQASGAEKSHRRTGTAARRDYASHVE